MSKAGRNDECPCGSGLKFKKCCLPKESNRMVTSRASGSSKVKLAKTLTDEFFQPMRLYYTIHDQAQLKTYLQNLKCIHHENAAQDWDIQYCHEAAELGLSVASEKIPKSMQPLVIGTIYIKTTSLMLLDVRSIERAEKLIKFIDRYIPKMAAEITHAAIYNQLVTLDENNIQDIHYDEIFNEAHFKLSGSEMPIPDAKLFAKQYPDPAERAKAGTKIIEENAKKPLPKVEKFPVHFYEDGLSGFSIACRTRQRIAMKHYQGYTDYTFYDLMQEFAQSPTVIDCLEDFQNGKPWIH
jgi:hypothetical protein